jgi:L-iditol 2-dehydrogenase
MASIKQDPMSFRRIRSSLLHGAKDLRLETRTIRPPNTSEVQIAIRSTGLCGSDLHYYSHFRNGDIQVLEPLTLGHESSGTVISVGSGIKNLKPGDNVALEVGLPCGICELCKQGRYNICLEMKFRSSAKSFPHAQGTLQERINHPANFCHKLPKELSLDMGALLEPLSVAIHGNRRAQLRPGAKVLVFGAGAVGLLVAAVARMQVEDCEVVIADIDAGRVDFAVKNGFAHGGFCVPLKSAKSLEEQLTLAQGTAKEIGKCEIGGGTLGQVDAVFECTGVPSCLQAAIYAANAGGRIMLIGMGTPIQTLPISAAALREVDIIGVFRYANTYPTGIELLQRAEALRKTGQDVPRFDKLVTHRYIGFEQIEDAFRMAGKTVDEKGNLVLKVVVEIGGDLAESAKL